MAGGIVVAKNANGLKDDITRQPTQVLAQEVRERTNNKIRRGNRLLGVGVAFLAVGALIGVLDLIILDKPMITIGGAGNRAEAVLIVQL